MATHLYCLVRRPADDGDAAVVDGVVGEDGHPVRRLAVSLDGAHPAFEAWVGTVERTALPPDATLPTLVQQHDRVVRAALFAPAVVPALLAAPYADDDDCRVSLRRRATEIVRLMNRAEDHLEMALVVGAAALPRDAAPSTARVELEPGGPGRQYLESVRAQDSALVHADAIEAFARQLVDALAPFVEDAATAGSPHLGQLSISHVVARGAAAAYRERASAMAPPEGVRFVVDGPRPLYRFAALTRRPGPSPA